MKRNHCNLLLLVTALLLMVAVGSCGGSGGKNGLTSPIISRNIDDSDVTIGEAILKLQPPEGFDKDLFKKFRETLYYELTRRGISPTTKVTAQGQYAPPKGSRSKVEDLDVQVLAPGNLTLTWTYSNQGDGFEDGLVNIQDITPVAENFFNRTDEFPEADVADYLEDGLINIQEITALAENFFGNCAGYAVEIQPQGSADWTEVATVPFDGPSRVEQAGRDFFLAGIEIIGAPVVPYFVRVRAYDQSGNKQDEAFASNTFLVEPGAGGPTINSISPTSANPGERVDFTASVTGTAPYTYTWTFGDPGEGFDPETWEETVGTDTVEAPGILVPATAGDYTINLTVTDASGLSDQFSGTFTVVEGPTAPQVTDIQPRTGVESTSYQFVPTVTGGAPPYTYSWTFPGDWVPDATDIERPTVTLGAAGNYQVTLVVTDSNSLTGELTIDFTVTAGEPPVINSISPDPLVVAVRGTRMITADVSGSPPIAYSWVFGTLGLVSPDSSDVQQPEVEGFMPGTDIGTLTVSNEFGEDSANFTIDVGVAPSVNSVSPNSGDQGTDVTFTVDWSGDPPATAITWVFEDAQGAWATPTSSNEESPTVTLTGSGGPHEGTVMIANRYGAGELTFNFTILTPGVPPVINGINPMNGAPSQIIDFTADVTGSTPFDYTWTFGNPGEGFSPETYSNTGDTVEAPDITVPSNPGSYTIQLDVSNGFPPDASQQFTFQVGYSETENNDAPGTANQITFPTMDWFGNIGGPGGYDGDTKDYVKFSATAGDILFARIDHEALSGSENVVLRVKNGSDQTQNASTIDGSDYYILQWVVTSTGTWFLQLSSQNLTSNIDYLLDVETFTPNAPWSSSTIDSTVNSGQSMSLEIVDGNPAVIYVSGSGIYFARNSQPDGIGTWNVTEVTSSGSSPSNLAVVNSAPAFVYTYILEGQPPSIQVKFARNSAGDGSGTWNIYNVTNPESVMDANYSAFSLVTASGAPAFSYLDINSAVSYARSQTSDGSGGPGTWDFVTIDNSQTFTAVDGEIVQNTPAVAYAGTGPTLVVRYAINSQADGLGTWTTQDIETSTEASFTSPSLKVVVGKPAVAYINETTKELLFARSTADNGLGSWTSGSLFRPGFSTYCSLAIVGGYSAIAAYHAELQDAMYFVNSSPDGSGTWNFEWIETEGTAGNFISLADVAGQPGAAFQHAPDAVNPVAKFARK